MRRVSAAACAILLIAVMSPAIAAEVSFGCFERVYDGAHLAAHPGQSVARIAVEVKPLLDAAPYEASATVNVTARGKAVRVYASGDCEKNADGLSCPMDEDAGSFTLSQGADGLKLTTVTEIRLHRANQGSEDSTGPYLKPDNREDRVFLLKPAPARACR